MRNLTLDELNLVGGADIGVCEAPPQGTAGEWQEGVGGALTGIYEGLVDFTSHVIERVAESVD